MKRIAITLVFLFMTSAALADVILYLYPSVMAKRGDVKLRSIAMIDCGVKEKRMVSSIVLPPAMYADGFIDQRELQRLVSRRINGPVTVFGTAVKINFPQNKKEPAPYRGIARGKNVKVIYQSGSIRIEVNGKALDEGMPGETISVKVKNRIIRAIVLDDERVKKQI